MKKWIRRSPLACFVAFTFGLSLLFGLLAFQIGGEKTFDDPRALPFLALTIWAPNVAAVVVAWSEGRAKALLGRVVAPAPFWVFGLALSPMAVAFGVGRLFGTTPDPIAPSTWVLLVGMNLALGPLGEELGWRGFLLERLATKWGTQRNGLLRASLGVGVIWALWHAPLWALPSPQSQISFAIFFATVVCFSVIMAALWARGRGALGPMVVFHLAANVGVGWLEVTGVLDAATAYAFALPIYTALAGVAAADLVKGARLGVPIDGRAPLRKSR